ncbi:MAG: hypothetical protein ACTSUE_14815 [Promethearchaeota archaeon]
MTKFLEIHKEGLFSNVVTFTHPTKPSRVRLIPAIHIGEQSYYSGILDKIGNQLCLYEFISGDKNTRALTKAFIHEEDFNKIIELVKHSDYFKVNRGVFKEYIKQHLPEEIRKFRKVIKKFFFRFRKSNLDEIFKIAEYSQYDSGNLILLNRYIADFLEVSFQLKEIDYLTDIPSRKNWVNVDLQGNRGDNRTREPLELSPPIINYFHTQVSTVLSSLGLYISLLEIEDPGKRRVKFANHILGVDETMSKMAETDLPNILLNVRNQIAIKEMKVALDAGYDFCVLYGAMHLIAFEKFLSSEGFVLHESEFVKIFGF